MYSFRSLMIFTWNPKSNLTGSNLQGYGPAVKTEEEVERAAVGDLNVVDHVAVDMNVAVDRHMNVNVTSSGQGTKTVILQIPKVG